MTSLTREEWDEIARRLREPFDPGDVDFRCQGKASEQTGKAQVVAYIDARAVQDRLDAVVGAGNWSFDWQPLVIDKGEVMVAKGTITIHGISKSDAGSASNFEQSLGAVSHCFKRAAVQWGIGRYLYNLPMAWVAVERGGRIPEPVLRELRAKLPRPGQTAKPRAEVLPEEPEQDAAAISQPGAQQQQPWNFLMDHAFRGRARALGYVSVSQVEELVTAACGAGQSVVKAKVRIYLEALEDKATAAKQNGAQSSDLRQAFTGQART